MQTKREDGRNVRISQSSGHGDGEIGGDLDLEQIKERINDRALDGIAVSCITHYANEQVGPEIEWDDDIDINYHNSTTEQWDKYFEVK